jgi:hypothetical protein
MIRRHFSLIAIASMVAFFALAADISAESGRVKPMKRRSPRVQTKTFAVSGVYSGKLAGEMKIGGRKVRMTQKTSVWMVGEGQGKRGIVVSKRAVYAMGVIRNGVPMVEQILVSPATVSMTSMSSPSNRNGQGEPPVGELPDSGPR